MGSMGDTHGAKPKLCSAQDHSGLHAVGSHSQHPPSYLRTCQRVMSWRPPTTSAPSGAPKPPRRSQYLRLVEVGTGSSVLLLLSPTAEAAGPPQQALGGGMGGVTVAMLLFPMPMGRCLVDWPQPASTSASQSQALARVRADQCISTRRRTAFRNCKSVERGGLGGRGLEGG